MKINTQLVHVGVGSDAKTGAITTPIYQLATFRHPALGQSTGMAAISAVHATCWMK